MNNTPSENESQSSDSNREPTAPESTSSHEVASNDDDTTALQKHYGRFFGESPLVYHEMNSTDTHIDVHIFPATEDRPFLTLATAGMSARPMNIMDTESVQLADQHGPVEISAEERDKHFSHLLRAEMILYLPSDWDFGSPDGELPVQFIHQMARYPHTNNTWLGERHTVSNNPPAKPFFEGSLLTTAYLMYPYLEDEDFYHFELADGRFGHIYWLQALTPAEAYVKRHEGSPEVEQALLESDIIALDIDRQCTVSSENRKQRRAREKAQRRREKAPRLQMWSELPCVLCGHKTSDVTEVSEP